MFYVLFTSTFIWCFGKNYIEVKMVKMTNTYLKIVGGRQVIKITFN